jgi:tetratricopeptide (TPR) repeat protein
MKDFFISYNIADKQWAEWIAWILEEAGSSVFIQAWDFRPGGNFVLDMHRAAAGTEKTIAVLSQNYLQAEYTQPEWAAAFTRDPQGKQRTLIPIRVRECAPEGLLASISYIDLISRSEEEARKLIFDGLKERGKPDEAPGFPGSDERTKRTDKERVAPVRVQYPGTSESNNTSEIENLEIPWNVPEIVRYFTGREEVLNKLYEALAASRVTALSQRQAISGLGGIGKTQTAIAYAHRHRAEYKAVLWVVAESRESLISDFVALASVLNLPERNVQEQNLVVAAVKRWLDANSDWLLILDNADEPKLIEEFLPKNSKGHILLTSRAQVFDDLDILNPVELDEMSSGDAKEFLLTRTGRRDLESDEERAIEELAKELDYLPLALEQAGAYIKQLRSNFQDYLVSYRQRGLDLLEKGATGGKNRKTVKTTWSLNFQQVEETSKAAADLLRVSAFLNPDRIPNELIRVGAVELGSELAAALANVKTDPLALDEVLRPLIQYSLIRRDRKTDSYDIHRLVQAVLQDGLDDIKKREWAERIVKAVARTLPDVDEINFSEWDHIEPLLPHAQACIELIENWNLDFLESAQLLNVVGRHLHLRARLSEAEPLYIKSRSIRETVLGPDDPLVATSLHNQAWLYSDQGKYAEAEPLYLRSISIREASLESNHLNVANSFSRIGWLYLKQGKYAETESYFRRSLEIREKLLPSQHIDIADSFYDLGALYYSQARYDEAELIIKRTLEIREKVLGPNHYLVANSLYYLALIHREHGRFAEAESVCLRAIAITEKALGENYPRISNILKNLALVYIEQERNPAAESLILRAVKIEEESLGRDHPDLAHTLNVLAFFYYRQGAYTTAEPLYMRSLEIGEKALGANHPQVAATLISFGELYGKMHNPSKGEPLIGRAVSIRRKVFGLNHPEVVNAMISHAQLLHSLNRKGKAQEIEAQARKIQTKLNKKNRRKKE